VELFTADGTLALTRGTFRGREEIGSFLDELGETPNRWESHMSHNPIIDIDGDSATGRWCYEVPVVWEDGTAGWSQGMYDETYRRVDDERDARRRRRVLPLAVAALAVVAGVIERGETEAEAEADENRSLDRRRVRSPR